MVVGVRVVGLQSKKKRKNDKDNNNNNNNNKDKQNEKKNTKKREQEPDEKDYNTRRQSQNYILATGLLGLGSSASSAIAVVSVGASVVLYLSTMLLRGVGSTDPVPLSASSLEKRRMMVVLTLRAKLQALVHDILQLLSYLVTP